MYLTPDDNLSPTDRTGLRIKFIVFSLFILSFFELFCLINQFTYYFDIIVQGFMYWAFVCYS